MKLHKKADPYLFLFFPLLVYLLVVLAPIVSSIWYSLMEWNGITDMKFVGAANYIKLFKDTTLRVVLANSLIYAIICTICQVGFGLVLAIVIQQVRKGPNLIRVLLFTPTVISSMAISQTFKKLLAINPDGVVNALLEVVGLAHLKTAFLSHMQITLPVVALVDSFRFFGLYMVVFHSAFIAIDHEVLEASSIDGANKWQTLIYIQLPMMRTIIINCLILVMIGTFKAFEGPFILTGGGPGYASEIIATYMYKEAFTKMNYGYGSALSILIIILCLGIYAALNKITRRKGDAMG